MHANGDATGAEIVRALSESTKQDPNIEIWDDHFVIDLITEDGECYGALVQKPDGQQVFVRQTRRYCAQAERDNCIRYTTNPDVATGDGIAIAYRAGAHNSGYGIHPIPSDSLMLSRVLRVF